MSENKSMDEVFIEKLNNFMEANLENEQFGVNELADEMGVSRSQLHRKLNGLLGKSTSQFIREFRLEKAHEMLLNDVATASEIAYRVGFGSPTYFNTCFKEYYGYTPGEAKLRAAGTEEESKIVDTDTQKLLQSKETSTNNRFKYIGLAIIGAMIIIASVWIINSSENNPDNEEQVALSAEKSIAVLPFKNLSENKDNQYFADGMRDDIINHLSKIKGILVKSRQSSNRYGTTDLSGLEIGEALGVNYIIDGSVQKDDNRIKIIVHLINTMSDTQLWSKSFEREFEDIFQLESEISRDIAEELDLVLSPEEIKQIQKIPTAKVEAYNLYLQGRHFMYMNVGEYRNPEENYRLSEKYFKESIAADSEFALPYTGLAELVLYKGYPYISQEDYLKARDYARTALELDSSLAETHRTLALIHMEYEWDWEKSEREFQRAIEIDPNNANVCIDYARYLMLVKGEDAKARELINRAQELSPVAYFIYVISAEAYLRTEEYESALQAASKAIEINPENLWGYWVRFLAYNALEKYDSAINELVVSWKILPNTKVNIEPMLEAYDKGGINGVFRWINKLDIEYADDKRTFHNAFWIAQKFAYVGEDDKAMEWLHISYDKKSAELHFIKYDPHFKNMRSNPQFLNFLKKMNLGDYSSNETFLN